MNPIPKTQQTLQKIPEQPKPDSEPLSWKAFYETFSHKEKQLFLQRQCRLISHLIVKQMWKMKESLRKLKEGER